MVKYNVSKVDSEYNPPALCNVRCSDMSVTSASMSLWER